MTKKPKWCGKCNHPLVDETCRNPSCVAPTMTTQYLALNRPHAQTHLLSALRDIEDSVQDAVKQLKCFPGSVPTNLGQLPALLAAVQRHAGRMEVLGEVTKLQAEVP